MLMVPALKSATFRLTVGEAAWPHNGVAAKMLLIFILLKTNLIIKLILIYQAGDTKTNSEPICFRLDPHQGHQY